MNIYNAIMATADHIERNPDEFKFSAVYIPNSPGCGTPGCALGWIGTFLGVSEARAYEEGQSAATVLHIGSRYLGVLCRDHNDNMNEFYSRMNEFDKYWKIGPQECSKALRLYAASAALNHFIRGRREPRIDNLRKISTATGISIENLVKGL